MPTSKRHLKCTSILVKMSKANVETTDIRHFKILFSAIILGYMHICLCTHECINLCAK